MSSQSFNTWTSWASTFKRLAADACTSIGGVLASYISWCGTLEPIWVDATLNNFAVTCLSCSGSILSTRKSQFQWRVCLWPGLFLMTYTGTSMSTWLHTMYTSSLKWSFNVLFPTNWSFLTITTSPLFSVTVEAFWSYLRFCLNAYIWVIFHVTLKAFLSADINSAAQLSCVWNTKLIGNLGHHLNIRKWGK